jgi:hypothetical protein
VGGVPCSAGYGHALPDQPLFRRRAFGPYLPGAAPELDYSEAQCPNADLLCGQSIWLDQSLLLGSREDMDDVARAFEKVYEHRHALASLDVQAH